MPRPARLALLLLAPALLGSVAVADDTPPPRDAAVTPVSVPLIDQSLLLAYLAGRQSFTLIDARSREEFEAAHILRAVNVPHDAVDAHAEQLPADRAAPIVIYCKTGKRATELMAALHGRGYADVRVLGPSQIFWSDEAPMFNCGAPLEQDTSFLPSEP